MPTPAKDSTARSGQRIDDLGRVAEQRGQRPAGVEVELPVGVQCHVAVLLPHVGAQRFWIDRDRFRHPPSPLFKWMFEQSRPVCYLVK